MLRVIGGEFKRRKLDQPSLDITRPTKDIAKEGLFNSLGDIEGLTFLDCFGGSGAMGIEARSRHAKDVTIIEYSKEAFKVILKNLSTIGINDVKVINDDFFRAIKRLKRSFDIIFIDPPYKMEIGEDFVQTLIDNELVSDKTRIVIERDTKLDEALFNDYEVKELKYGKSFLYILKTRS